MKNRKTYTVQYRRKRKGLTDYRKRMKLLLAGKPRLVVRKSLKDMTAQVVVYDRSGDKVIVQAKASSLRKIGWKYGCSNIPSAYLLGMLIAKKAKEHGQDTAILDIGFNKSVPASKIFALLKGALDAGLDIPHSESVLPDQKRIEGRHIKEYAENLKAKNMLEKRFSLCLKEGSDPAKIVDEFILMKKKIGGA